MSDIDNSVNKLFNGIIGGLLVSVIITLFVIASNKTTPVTKNHMDFVRGIEHTIDNNSVSKRYLGKTLVNYISIDGKDYILNNELASSIGLELKNKKSQKVILIVNSSENRIENIIRK